MLMMLPGTWPCEVANNGLAGNRLGLVVVYLDKDLGGFLNSYKTDVGKKEGFWKGCVITTSSWRSVLFRERDRPPSSTQHPFHSMSTELQSLCDGALLGMCAVTKTQDSMLFLLWRSPNLLRLFSDRPVD